MYHFDEQILLATLSKLPHQALVAFAASCASRLAPGYEIAQGYLKEGDPKLIAHALDRLWRFATEGKADEWEAVSEQLIGSIPDEEEGPTLAHGVIDDSLAAAAYAARAALGAKPTDALFSAKRVYEAVDRFAGLKIHASEYTRAVEAQIIESPIVQDELARQAKDVADLSESSFETLGQTIETIRQRSSHVSALPLDEVLQQAMMATSGTG
jgi:hypothetical protein